MIIIEGVRSGPVISGLSWIASHPDPGSHGLLIDYLDLGSIEGYPYNYNNIHHPLPLILSGGLDCENGMHLSIFLHFIGLILLILLLPGFDYPDYQMYAAVRNKPNQPVKSHLPITPDYQIKTPGEGKRNPMRAMH